MSKDRESDAERFATLARESLRVKDADGHLYLRPSVIRIQCCYWGIHARYGVNADQRRSFRGGRSARTGIPSEMLAKRIAEENPTQDRATIDAEATKLAQYQRVATVASHAESDGYLAKFNLWRTQVEGGIKVSLRDATVSMDSETVFAVPPAGAYFGFSYFSFRGGLRLGAWRPSRSALCSCSRSDDAPPWSTESIPDGERWALNGLGIALSQRDRGSHSKTRSKIADSRDY